MREGDLSVNSLGAPRLESNLDSRGRVGWQLWHTWFEAWLARTEEYGGVILKSAAELPNLARDSGAKHPVV